MDNDVVRRVFVVDLQPLQTHAPHRLDDGALSSMVEFVRATLARNDIAWTDRNQGDPGMTLIGLFALVTELLTFQTPARYDKQAARLAFSLLSTIEHARPMRAGRIRFGPGMLLTEEDIEASVDYTRDDAPTAAPPDSAR